MFSKSEGRLLHAEPEASPSLDVGATSTISLFKGRNSVLVSNNSHKVVNDMKAVFIYDYL
jgi:hypothetical protein